MIHDIRQRLLQARYAPFAAELLTLQDGIERWQHVGEAITARLDAIDQQVQET